MSIEDQVSAHYTTATLLERVLAAVAEAGGDPDALTPGDLKAVDEFHTGGLQATDALLEQLEIDQTTRVLDIGCGIGGTARHIRNSYNTPVTGFDLTPDFVATADALTRRIGLEGITFLTGSALDMPVETGSFDLATMFHVGMNIEDKATLMQEAWRVLAPGGTFALFDVMKVGEGAIPYPVPWAEDAGFSFVAPPETYRAAAGTAGFETGAERARGDFALAFFERVFATIAEQGVAPVGIHLLMRETAGQKIENYVAAVTAGTIAPVEMIFRKPK